MDYGLSSQAYNRVCLRRNYMSLQSQYIVLVSTHHWEVNQTYLAYHHVYPPASPRFSRGYKPRLRRPHQWDSNTSCSQGMVYPMTYFQPHISTDPVFYLGVLLQNDSD